MSAVVDARPRIDRVEEKSVVVAAVAIRRVAKESVVVERVVVEVVAVNELMEVVPKNEGLVLKTIFPVPVSSPKSVANSPEVSTSSEDKISVPDINVSSSARVSISVLIMTFVEPRILSSSAIVSIEVVASFELKVLQSALERRPSATRFEAVGILSVCVEPLEEKPQPVAADDVVANDCVAAVRPLSEVMAPTDDEATHWTPEPVDWR